MPRTCLGNGVSVCLHRDASDAGLWVGVARDLDDDQAAAAGDEVRAHCGEGLHQVGVAALRQRLKVALAQRVFDYGCSAVGVHAHDHGCLGDAVGGVHVGYRLQVVAC